jgi:hypothetical protein
MDKAVVVSKRELIPELKLPENTWPEPGITILKTEATFGFVLLIFFSNLEKALLI